MLPESGERARRAQLARIITGHVCLHASMTGSRMAAPLLALNQGHGKAAVGLLVALFALTQIFLSLPAGRYADRHGLRRPVGLAVIASSVGVGLAAIWPTYPVLCLTALLCGGAVGAATIAVQRHVGRMATSTAERRQAFSWLAIAPAASNFLGPFASGLVIDLARYQAAFVLLACMPLVGWTLLRSARELPEEPVASRGGAAWDLLLGPGMRRLLLMNWFMTASWDLHGFMVPVLGHERGLQASAIGSILGGFALAAACVRIVMPLFAGRLQEWVLITGATAAAGVLFLLYPLTSTALEMGICSAALGFVLSVVQPTVMSMLHQITPRERHGEALAVRLIMVNASSVGMPLLFGMAGFLTGVTGVFLTMGVILACGSRLGLGLRGLGDDQDESGH
ncbi:MFS transporter [Variovorax rhizosphaerae]|uniref:MFS transporter n=1 Tax=Variovorax rhizosphaerae TaxID=1836200 RepID=A0ABU8WV93_9BURK